MWIPELGTDRASEVAENGIFNLLEHIEEKVRAKVTHNIDTTTGHTKEMLKAIEHRRAVGSVHRGESNKLFFYSLFLLFLLLIPLLITWVDLLNLVHHDNFLLTIPPPLGRLVQALTRWTQSGKLGLLSSLFPGESEWVSLMERLVVLSCIFLALAGLREVSLCFLSCSLQHSMKSA